MTDYLTPAEIRELTGRTRHKAQLRQLARQCIPATTDADGRVLVLRAARDSVMASPAASPKRRSVEPDWEKLRLGFPSKSRRQTRSGT